MASEDVVREAALYLEYFLKGLSECNVVGSYTVQFLDVQGFSVRLEASLASHLIRLVTNMKALLLKFNSSLLPYCNVEVQTELTELCSVCNSQSSCYGDFKTVSLQSAKEDSDTASSEGLMYSVYTMSSCGSLQLVSRILSKTNMLKDNLNEPVEKAMIEINSFKEEFDSKETDNTFILQGNNIQDNDSVDQERGEMAPGSSECEDNSKNSSRISRSPRLLDIKSSNVVSAFGSVITDTVKLGPEDLESSTWCGICEAELPSSRSLKTHVSRMHSKVRCCNTCNKTIKAEDMCDHVRECHNDLPYVCNVCGQSLRSNGGFQRHMDIHKGVRGNACEICGRTFSRTEYYRDHKRIHTGEKPYQCQTCKKTFSRSSNLHTHMRIHNREEERLTCNVCLKSFARTDKLKDHMIRHLQIKRYACRLCSKSYNEKRDLIKHIDKIHSNDTDCGTE